MNLNEATHILKSVGYNIDADLDKMIDIKLNDILESMELRGAVKTGAYKILYEMAIKKPRNVTDDNPWNDADEKFSKLQSTIQSKMTRGGSITPSTRSHWLDHLNTFKDEVSNPSVKRALPGLEDFLNSDNDIYTSVNNHNTGILTGDFSTDRKNISSSISTLGSHGGKNYDALLARIDELETNCGADCTPEEANAIEKLRLDLETAQQKALVINNSKGKTAIFKPANDTPMAQRRILRRLDQNRIAYTVGEDGLITITSKVSRAKDVLAEFGEFINPEVPETAAETAAEPTELNFTVEDPEAIGLMTDIVTDNGGEIVVDNETNGVHITGTKKQIKAIQAELMPEFPELFEIPAEA